MMRTSTKVLSDPFIVPRVKQYLEENVHQTYVDVAVMARQLQKRYNEYNKRQTEPFLQLVEEAYRIVVQSYGLDIDSSSESDQSDIEMVEEDDSSNKSMNILNNMVTKLYEKSGNKKDLPISSANKEQNPEEKGPINISSDEEENESNKNSNPKPSASIPKVVGLTTIRPAKLKDDKPQNPQPIEQQNKQPQPQLENQSKIQVGPPQILQCIPQKQLLQTSQAREPMPRSQYRAQRFPKSSAENSVKSSNRLLKKRLLNDEAQGPVNNNNKFGPKKKEKDRNVSRAGDARKIAMLDVSKIDLTNIGGIDEKLIKLCEILFNIKHSHIYKHIGLKPPKGILIHGPPGCGKTMLAMGIAGTLKYPIISCNATEFIAGVSGESEERIRSIFEQAIEIGDCIILIDNIDVIGTNQAFAEKEMSRRVVSQLISCLDHLTTIEEDENIVVVGITRKPEILDPGLTGDGRFDFEISLGIPDRKQRVDIMRVICENVRLEPNFNFDQIAKLTPGYVGGDLKSLVKKACSIVVRRRYIEEIKALQAEHNKNIPTIDLDGGDESMRETAEKNDGNTDVTTIDEAASDINVSDPVEAISKKPRLEEEYIADNTVEADQEMSECNKTNGANDENMQGVENELGETIQVSTEDDKDENINVDNNEANSVDGLQTNEKSTTKLLETETEAEAEAEAETGTETGTETAIVEADEPTNKEIACELSNCNSELSEKEKCGSNSSQPASESMNTRGFSSKPKVRLLEMINLLNDEDVLTESILDHMSVGMDDFEEALKDTKPAALREGFLTVPDVTWNDIGSLQNIREELQLAIFTQVKYPEKLQALGITMPAGVLLCGPPGCGKTLLAKAIANEAGINFISVKGPELLNMYVGESERAIRTCFQRARNSAPCVVFFDEFDALCPRRAKSSESYQSRIVNQLLTEMDGVESRKGVYLLAATNRPDILDPAVLRPGRLETILYVGLPNDSDREQILCALSKNGTKPSFEDDVKLSEISSLTDGFSGADLAGLLRQASYLALNFAIKNPEQAEDNLNVRRQDFLDALKLIKPSVTPEDRLMYLKLRDQYAAPRDL